jgi:hypothetical protein
MRVLLVALTIALAGCAAPKRPVPEGLQSTPAFDPGFTPGLSEHRIVDACSRFEAGGPMDGTNAALARWGYEQGIC